MSADRVRDALVVTGRDLDVLAYAVQLARAVRRREGRRPLPDLDRLAGVLSPGPDEDTPAGDVRQPELMTTSDAAQLLGCTRRTATRLAPRLDGRLVAGRWMLPATAVAEHLAGAETR